MSEGVHEPEVLFQQQGSLGHIVLNRPKAINALTHGMVSAVDAQLRAWADDASVAAVLVSGNGERGLCAGGDIVGLYRAATSGDPGSAARFWADEYRMNHRIATYPKPYLAIMDGIVLGGGIGISAHGSHRIVTERSSLGLPEVGIGFIPDVGSTWLLARAPGELGTHVALTGGSVGAADAIRLGLADAFIPSDALPAFVASLERDTPAAAVAAHARPPGSAPLDRDREWIDRAYAGDDPRAILARLDGEPAEGAKAAAAAIRTKSPTSVAVALAALRRAAVSATLGEVLTQDYRLAMHALVSPDFAEGVRAQVIDKDRSPRWSPDELPAPEAVAAFFAPIDDEPHFGEAATQGGSP